MDDASSLPADRMPALDRPGALGAPMLGDIALADGSLDPAEWSKLRALGHRMVDDAFDELAGIRQGLVWSPMPDAVRAARSERLPRVGGSPQSVYADFRDLIAPQGGGNRHPKFFGWVHG